MNNKFYIHAVYRSDDDPDWPNTWYEYRLTQSREQPERDQSLFYSEEIDEVHEYLDKHYPGHETTVIDDN